MISFIYSPVLRPKMEGKIYLKKKKKCLNHFLLLIFWDTLPLLLNLFDQLDDFSACEDWKDHT